MSIKKIEKARKEWEAKELRPSQAKIESRQKTFSTTSEIVLPDLSLPQANDFSEEHYLSAVGFPGQFPYTRGVHPTMYRSRLWTMRQYSGFGDAEEANKRYHYLLSKGTTGLSVAFDLPTQMGRDSDHALAKGEVGRVGVAIDTLEDMERLFSGIALEKISTSMTINATAHILLCLYIALAKKQGVSLLKLRGTTQNDILKEYVARGTYVYGPKAGLKIVTDIFEYCHEHLPEWNTISISGYHIREAGSTAVQEIAFTLANAVAYVEKALERGLKVDDFAPRLAFFFNCHNNFLEEIAKFRAARRLWARIVKKKWKAKNERSMMLRFHTQTAGSSLTAQQPYNNIMRTTIQALAAVLGGTQSLHTNSFDEALGLPSEEAATIALRTQQIIGYESGVADVVDPLGGSYCIEQLTDALEDKAQKLMIEIEKMGGMVEAISQGFPQKEIEDAAFEYQQAMEQGNNHIVGVTILKEKEEHADVHLLKIDSSLEERQLQRLRAFKEKREKKAFEKALGNLCKAAQNDQNIMPFVLESVEMGSTLGEISDVLRDVFGEY